MQTRRLVGKCRRPALGLIVSPLLNGNAIDTLHEGHGSSHDAKRPTDFQSGVFL